MVWSAPTPPNTIRVGYSAIQKKKFFSQAPVFFKEDPVSILYMNEGNCGPDTGMNWTLIGIILGAVVGAVIIIGIIGVVISRKSGYRQAATN